MKLGVNVDHVATLRNARGEDNPNPVQAALVAQQAGADNITCHLREDRRHIKDEDVRKLKEKISVPLNLEMAATAEMQEIALAIEPHEVTIVPEGRQELTTEGGYQNFNDALSQMIATLHAKDIKVALFIDPTKEDTEKAKKSGADAVEFHVGEICTQLATSKNSPQTLHDLISVANIAHDLNLAVHIGHGINYHVAPFFRAVPHVVEANIGHALIAEAIFCGLTDAVQRMKSLLNS